MRILRLGIAAAILWAALSSTCPSATADTFTWDNQQGKVKADVRDWSLTKVLQNIAAATGWHVYVEPEAETTISVKFKWLTIGDALRRLLGGFNYALVPETNGVMRLYVFRTSMADATRPITPTQSNLAPDSEGANRLADEIIVRVKPGTNIEELARVLGAKVIGAIPGCNAYRLKFDTANAAEAGRSKLVTQPEVESVEYNYAISRPAQAQPVLASSVPPLNLKFNPPGNNGRLIIGLIDTPIQSLGGELDTFFLKAIPLAGEAQPSSTTPTHATAMAYTILMSLQSVTGGKTSAQILPVDIYGNNPITSTFDVARGIVEAVNAGANVINLSLGTEADSKLLHEIIQQAHKQGVVFYGAAGNVPVNTPVYPAAYPEVTAVTAGDRNHNIAPFANPGDFVDMVAPGVSIVNYAGQPFVITGTSASAAFATGLAAGIADLKGTTPIEADKLLRTNFAPNKTK